MEYKTEITWKDGRTSTITTCDRKIALDMKDIFIANYRDKISHVSLKMGKTVTTILL